MVLTKQAKALRRKYQKDLHQRKRRFLVEYYGSICKCCRESEYLFLMLDHTNDDGAIHRRSLTGKNKVGTHLVDDLYRKIKTGLPTPEIQLLCANCNIGRFRNGGACPHDARS